MDSSGSMDYPAAKIAEAGRPRGRRRRDPGRRGVRGDRGHRVPRGRSTRPTGRMAVADERTRAAAKRRVRRCGPTAAPRSASGCGWPTSSSPRARRTLRHAILLTDGKNQHETPEELAAAIACARACSAATAAASAPTGRSASCARSPPRCSARSTSSPTRPGWPPTSRRMMRGAMSKQLPDVLAAGVDAETRGRQVRQAGRPGHRRPDRPAAPVRRAGGRLPDRGVGRRGRAATTTWRQVNPAGRRPGDARGAGQPGRELADGQQVLGQGLVRAMWTDDEALSTRINPQGRPLHRAGGARRRRSRTGLRPTSGATRSPRPRGSAAPSRWRTRRATRRRPGCWPAWWTWWTRPPAPSG